ncbi:hypothetical protein RND71_032140 [Anisodus tanguticus]|uniref:Uncharacterized protein n=1 Tax=Anisodus tanguticus TaxID=243964 RepID=A0AAE1RC18_9SOLA|nr:hypothetical protein RND71_032140 [Anisodus tanguticus]
MKQITERRDQGKLDLVEKTVCGVTQKTSNEASLSIMCMSMYITVCHEYAKQKRTIQVLFD